MIQRLYYTDLNGDNPPQTDKYLYIDSVGASVFEEDFPGGHHKKRNDYHLLYLYYGELNIKSYKNQFNLKSGQLIIFPPNTSFVYKNLSKSKLEYLWINFSGTNAENLIHSVYLETGVPIDVSIPEYIFEAFETLYAEFNDRTPFFDTAIMYKLMHILVLFGRSHFDLNNKFLDLGSLTKSLTYINDNFSEEITTEKLAEMEHLSPSHYRRIFKNKTGMTPTQYITLVKLRHAEMLLLKTDMNIKQISEIVGFDNQLYFSKVFSKHFGKSPKKYR